MRTAKKLRKWERSIKNVSCYDQLPNKDKCLGCMACVNACYTRAVRMKRDRFGCLYAQINSDKCVQCGGCVKVCPALSKSQRRGELGYPKIYAALSQNEEARLNSTSGGIFPLLAEVVLERGGCVAGAAYRKDFQVRHILVYTKAGLEQLKQSKYVQSTPGTIYHKVKKELLNGKTVLFSGTPCQIEALNLYLGNKTYNNLITCEVICVGVSMPKIYADYLKILSKQYRSKPQRVWFKNKEDGWNFRCTLIIFQNGEIYKADRESDLFHKGFRKYNFFVRPACFHCRFRGSSRFADITLGDFWSLKKTLLDDSKGLSLVLLNTAKGDSLFKSILPKIWYERHLLKEAMRNQGLSHNVKYTTMIKIFRELYGKLPLTIIIKIADFLLKIINKFRCFGRF